MCAIIDLIKFIATQLQCFLTKNQSGCDQTEQLTSCRIRVSALEGTGIPAPPAPPRLNNPQRCFAEPQLRGRCFQSGLSEKIFMNRRNSILMSGVSVRTTYVCSAVALLSLMKSASGAVITYTANFPGSATFSNTQTSTTIPEFNPSLGTLTGVSFSGQVGTLSDSAEGYLLGASSSEPADVVLSSQAVLSSSASGLGYLDSSNLNAMAFAVVSASAQSPTLVTATATNLDFSFSGSPSLTTVEGTGDLPLTLAAVPEGASSAPYQFQTEGNPTGYMSTDSVTVNYTYTPAQVPEPASLGILGVGAAALLGRRRRVA
jgi:hypothetical protein